MKVLKNSLLIIGAIIGAGFASGREIYTFFAKYGTISLLYILPLFLFLWFFIFYYLNFGSKFTNFNLKTACPLLCKNRKIIFTFNPLSLGLFLTFLVLSSAMMSALVALILTYFPNTSKCVAYFISIFFTTLISLGNLRLFSKVSNFCVPLIICCVLITVIFSFGNNSFFLSLKSANPFPLPVMTLLYASVNTYFACFVIIKTGESLTLKQQKATALAVALTISLLILAGVLCFIFNPHLKNLNLPFAEIATYISPLFSLIFCLVLFLSILTTLCSSVESLKEYFSYKSKPQNLFLMLLLITTLSLLNFGKIIDYLYPIIGVIGLINFYYIYKFNSKNQLIKIDNITS